MASSRVRRRALRLVACCGLVGLAMVSRADGYWSATGAGSGTAAAGALAAGLRPTASAVAGTVTITWEQTAFGGVPLGTHAAGRYTVERRSEAGGPVTEACTDVTGATATLSCQEEGVPSGSWKYTVTPRLGSWTGDAGPPSATLGVVTDAPSLVMVAAENPADGATTGDIRLTWTGTGDHSYHVYRRDIAGAYDDANPVNGATPVTESSYVDPGSGLSGGTTYGYVVRATTGGGLGPRSDERTVTAVGRLAAPASVLARPGPAARIDVSWAAVPEASGYDLYRRTDAGAYDDAAPLNGATPLTATSSADTTAAHGVAYRYVVRAVGAGATTLRSARSVEASATADGVGPGTVTADDPGPVLAGTITLSGSAADTGSGVSSLLVQTAPAGTPDFTDACADATAPYACTWDTTTRADGLYDVRAVATDRAGNVTTSAAVTGRRIDNTAPAVAAGDPGEFLRGTVTLTATASDGGAGLSSLRLQRAATGTTTYVDVCTQPTSPASCTLNTTTLPSGGIDLRAIATDAAGNVRTSALVVDRIVDNVAPTATDIQIRNRTGGTLGRPESGDVVTFTFSEPVRPASILAGWTGAGTPVTLRITQGTPDVLAVANAANTALLSLGTTTVGRNSFTANATVPSSTMTLSGNTITVTLGTPSGAVATSTATNALAWTPSAAATDRAGNPMSTVARTETGAADADF